MDFWVSILSVHKRQTLLLDRNMLAQYKLAATFCRWQAVACLIALMGVYMLGIGSSLEADVELSFELESGEKDKCRQNQQFGRGPKAVNKRMSSSKW